jgi:uncharacterized small protein (DUF1192 family)
MARMGTLSVWRGGGEKAGFRPELLRESRRLVKLAVLEMDANPMAIDPEELLPRKKAPEVVLGEDLSAMSEFELATRIARLEGEIARCRDAITARKATRSAADSFFKR